MKDFVPHSKNNYPVVFSVVSGSRMYGMETETSDWDYIGAVIEPPTVVFSTGFSHEEWKNPDLNAEGVLYSFKKFVSLLLDSNPTLLCCLFAKPDVDSFNLLEVKDLFLSASAQPKFLGYAYGQLTRLEKGSGMHVVRKDLREKYGYDTKYASHLIRLCKQGIELLTTGQISVPVNSKDREELLAIRNGSLNKSELLSYAQDLLAILKECGRTSILPPEPNREAVIQWLADSYLSNWRAK